MSIFARRCKPSGSNRCGNEPGGLLLLFYSGGVVVSPWKVGGFSSQYLATDVEYLHRISCDQSIHGDFTLEMAIRGSCITCEDIMVFLWKLLILFEEKWGCEHNWNNLGRKPENSWSCVMWSPLWGESLLELLTVTLTDVLIKKRHHQSQVTLEFKLCTRSTYLSFLLIYLYAFSLHFLRCWLG